MVGTTASDVQGFTTAIDKVLNGRNTPLIYPLNEENRINLYIPVCYTLWKQATLNYILPKVIALNKP